MSQPGFVWCGLFQWKLRGFEEEARHFVRALAEGNVPVKPVRIRFDAAEPTPAVGEIPPDYQLCDASLATVTEGLPRAILDAPVPDPYIMVWHSLPRLLFHDPGAAANVARVMSETDGLPAEAVRKLLSYDEVWVPSDFNMESFAAAGVPASKLYKIPETLDLDLFTPEGPAADAGFDRSRFRFFSCFEWSERKGFDVLIEAYLEEFSHREPVQLMIKSWSKSRDVARELADKVRSVGRDEHPPLQLLDRDYAAADMPALYRAADCFVLPSRGEGWGRPYMEAMACGLPTIGSRWGGNLEFMTDDNSFLIDCKTVPVSAEALLHLPLYRGQHWAAPDKWQLRAHLRHVFENATAARAVGARARADVASRFSYRHIADMLRQKLGAA